MHYKFIASTRSFYMGLTSAEGQNIEFSNEQQIIFW